jgi:hypothetical protein
MGAVALHPGLALDDGSPGQSLVSDNAIISAEKTIRVGRDLPAD